MPLKIIESGTMHSGTTACPGMTAALLKMVVPKGSARCACSRWKRGEWEGAVRMHEAFSQEQEQALAMLDKHPKKK